MTPDIRATINRLKELEQKATPAPWKAIEGDDDGPTEVARLNSAGVYQDAVFFPATDSVPDFSDYHIAPDIAFLVELRNAAPTLIANHEATARKLALYEKRMAYIAKHYPLAHLDALEHAPEQEN